MIIGIRNMLSPKNFIFSPLPVSHSVPNIISLLSISPSYYYYYFGVGGGGGGGRKYLY